MFLLINTLYSLIFTFKASPHAWAQNPAHPNYFGPNNVRPLFFLIICVDGRSTVDVDWIGHKVGPNNLLMRFDWINLSTVLLTCNKKRKVNEKWLILEFGLIWLGLSVVMIKKWGFKGNNRVDEYKEREN